jgi:hypothetical protein
MSIFSGLKPAVFPGLKIFEEFLPHGVVPDAFRAAGSGHGFIDDGIIDGIPVVLTIIRGPEVKHKHHMLTLARGEIGFDGLIETYC